MDATVFIATDNTLVSTSSDYHYISIQGDTVRVATARGPAGPSATGNTGEICWNSQTVLGITTGYLYICVAPNTWRRAALSVF